MDEEARKKYCGLLMFDIPPSHFSRKPDKGESMSLMIDCTTSLENSCIRTQDNFVFTSFVEPMKVKPQPHIRKVPSLSEDPINTMEISNNVSTNFDDNSRTKRTPRPPNAFILYRKSMQPEISKREGNISNSEISKILAQLWKSESDSIRLYWQRQADFKKIEHMQAYPGYVYRPKKSRENSKRKRKKNSKLPSSNSSELQRDNIIENCSSNNLQVIAPPPPPTSPPPPPPPPPPIPPSQSIPIIYYDHNVLWDDTYVSPISSNQTSYFYNNDTMPPPPSNFQGFFENNWYQNENIMDTMNPYYSQCLPQQFDYYPDELL
ncbi:hypothetical protein Glove_294g166 [Diversispora epigaea]|uniref:HMG box domain-containing protein n=1 Tax=Diversispora epigaea TaxID=1348612 RepID=A0A397I0D8_9GLOM|nr:hypothetical protein Glove_294g166 [Diversispora epigaea]